MAGRQARGVRAVGGPEQFGHCEEGGGSGVSERSSQQAGGDRQERTVVNIANP